MLKVGLLCRIFLIATIVVGCSQTQPEPPSDALSYSLDAWTQLKNENGNHYTYDRTFLSYFGFGHRTSFEVENDVVISRTYLALDAEGNTTESWTETGEEVGSHENGDPPRTVEALYDECRRDLLSKSRVENDVYLAFNNDVLYQCFYVPKNCADDCAVGPSIENLSFVGKDNEGAGLE